MKKETEKKEPVDFVRKKRKIKQTKDKNKGARSKLEPFFFMINENGITVI